MMLPSVADSDRPSGSAGLTAQLATGPPDVAARLATMAVPTVYTVGSAPNESTAGAAIS